MPDAVVPPYVHTWGDSAEVSLEFFPSAYAAAEHEYAIAGGDEDEAVLAVQPRDAFVDAECL